MWRRIRAFVVWAALIVVAAVSIGGAAWMIRDANRSEVAYKQLSKDSAKTDAQRANINKIRDCGPLAPPTRAKCEAEEDYAAHQAQHDDRDLEAQRTTAVWTRNLGIAGIIGTAFGLLGVALVLLTFMDQRRTSRAELRAYVDVSKTVLGEIEGAHFIEISITNFGQTPATNVCTWADAQLRKWPITEDPEPVTQWKFEGTLPPGHPRRTRLVFKAGEYAEMLANTASFVIPVKITYDFLGGLGSDEFRTCVVVTADEAKTGEGRYLGHRDRQPRNT